MTAVLLAACVLTVACGGTDPARASTALARTSTTAPASASVPAPVKALPPAAPSPHVRAVASPIPAATSSATPTARSTDAATTAFDLWRDARVRRAAQNLRALLAGRRASGAAIAGAAELPAAFTRAAACGTVSLRLEVASLHPLPELLPWLGFAVGDLHTGRERALRRWLWTEQYLPALNPVRREFGLRPLDADDLERGTARSSGVPRDALARFEARLDALSPQLTAPGLFAQALELAGGDVYRALLTTHNLLRDDRSDPRVQAVLTPLRTDGGDDSGAYYHLFGMATYALAYELATSVSGQAALDLAGPNPVPPEVAAALEEVLVSDRQGDVAADPTELAIDLLGARVGRHLYATLAAEAESPGSGACATPAAAVPV